MLQSHPKQQPVTSKLHSVVMPYTLPKYHTGKQCYVDFCCFDPVEQKMKRKKYFLDSIKGATARKKYAAELIARLTEKLRSGWNVWCQIENSREMTSLHDALSYYEIYLNRASQTGTLKEKTVYGYLSYLKIFREWLDHLACKVAYCYQLTTPLLSDFLDYVLIDREASARTRNNYRIWLSTLMVWLVEKGYCSNNYAESIRVIREEDTRREELTSAQLKQLREHLLQEDKHFLLACMWEYYTFIRPKELSYIRLSDISIAEQKVFIGQSISKNRRDGMVALNQEIIKLMIDLDIFNSPSEYYLFGKGFCPSATRADSRIFRERWAKLRKKMRWGESCQFYSLKNSGIRDLANKEGIVVARDQARHTDISTTNKYLKGRDLRVHEETKHFKGAL